MLGCHDCQERLLDFLYELLDEADQRPFLDHLADCPACQAALQRARAHQALLGRAARMHFPEVVFSPPQPESAAPALHVPRPLRPTLPRRRLVLRWAAAAAVLLALSSVAVPLVRTQQQLRLAHHTVRAHDDALAEARHSVQAARQELTDAVREREEQLAQIRQELKARELRMVVTGPRLVQPGAPAEFHVRAMDLNDRPAEVDLLARLSEDFSLPSSTEKQDTRASDAPIRAEDASSRSKTLRSQQDGTLPVTPLAPGTYSVRIPPTTRLEAGKSLKMLVEARKKTADKQAHEVVSLQGEVKLSAPVFLTHLTTDKPMYQPGEIIRFRSLTVDRFTLAPATDEFRLHYTLTNPLGAVRTVARGSSTLLPAKESADRLTRTAPAESQPLRGLGAGEVALEPDCPGGEYLLTVSEELGRFPPVSRKFLVNRFQKPRLDKKLDFHRSSYGPAEEVHARVRAWRADCGPVAHRPVQITVTIDDRLYGPQGTETGTSFPGKTDEDGLVVVRFQLPKTIDRGRASLAVQFDDGGVVETIVRSIPLVLRKLDVEFFPEGGDLIAGLLNRVYFQVRTPLGKPAQLQGVLLEDGKPMPVVAATLHDDEKPGVNQGMGVFSFTPRFGRKYTLRIDRPAGISTNPELPVVRPEGVVLRVPRGVFEPHEPLPVILHSSKPRSLLVGAYCRGQLLDLVQVPNHRTQVLLRPTSGIGGVCRITVFEELPTGHTQRQLKPVAERLVYRHPRERLDVSISPDKRSYIPGEKVQLSLATTAENEKLTSAFALVAVTDQSVLTLADEKTYRSMPTHFLLTTEVRRPEDLEYADFLLGSHPKASQALDLLLGTQGWRRFAEQDPERFRKRMAEVARQLPHEEKQRHQGDEERLLVMSGQSEPQTTDFDRQKIDAVLDRFAVKAQQALERQQQASQRLQQVTQDEHYQAALAALQLHHERWQSLRAIAVPVLLSLVILLGLAALILALSNRMARSWTCLALTTACSILLVLTWRDTWTGMVPISEPQATVLAQADRHLPSQEKELEDLPLQAFLHPDQGGMHPGTDARPLARGLELGAAGVGGGLGGGHGNNFAEGFGGAGLAMGAETAAPAGPPATNGATPVAPAAMTVQTPLAKAGAERARGGMPGIPAPRQAVPNGNAANRPTEPKKPTSKIALGGPTLEDRPHLDRADRKTPLGETLTATKDLTRPGKTAEDKPGDLAKFKEQRERAGDGYFRLHNQNADTEKKLRGTREDGRRLLKEQFQLGRGVEGEKRHDLSLPLVYREYAHVRPPASPDAAREDFTETLYWHPVLILPDGQATVSFDLCDSVTSFQVLVYAHTLDGRLGAATKRIESRLPFTLAPKLPPEVTAGDRIDLPVALSNNTSSPRQVDLKLTEHSGLELLSGKASERLWLKADERARKQFRLRPTLTQGQAHLTLEGHADSFTDTIRHTLQVVPEGFPVSGASSDWLEQSATHRLLLPRWIPGTLQVRVEVFPSTLADLQKGLEGLLREPNGCFEQSSTANYPNVLILDYLKNSGEAHPALRRRARELLERGYQKLTSFECQQTGTNRRQGFEWFGGTAPPHEALTAYGLLQFDDMSRVFEVDRDLLARTRSYLLQQRDGKGGFLRNPRAVDTFGRAPKHLTDAYIVWALTQTGSDELQTELQALTRQAQTSQDPYFLSLVSLSLAQRGQTKEAAELLQRVVRQQKPDGHLEALDTSITSSAGRALSIETTALAVLGWLKTDPLTFHRSIRSAVRWISQQRNESGSFASTQSTILALKALLAWTKQHQRLAEAGVLRLFVGEAKLAELSFPTGADQPLTLTLPEPEKHLQAGTNTLRVEITGAGNVFPHTLGWSCRTPRPESSKEPRLQLRTRLARSELHEGDPVRLTVQLENVSGKHQGMAVAIVGLPAGLIVPEDLKQLKEYCKIPDGEKRPLLSAFEIRGRELVLYWRDLARAETIELPLDLIARVPGAYRGPASRAYLYYDADHKHWLDPLAVTIHPK